jgi:hypothetical protein
VSHFPDEALGQSRHDRRLHIVRVDDLSQFRFGDLKFESVSHIFSPLVQKFEEKGANVSPQFAIIQRNFDLVFDFPLLRLPFYRDMQTERVAVHSKEDSVGFVQKFTNSL